MTDFDLILGMDWLAANGATIDCKESCVMFQMPGLDMVIFRGNEKKPKSRIPIISAVKAFKALDRGCESYLAYVIDSDKVEPGIEDILVVRNKVIPYVKVLWSNHSEREATWELESLMRSKYPALFAS
ncbi:hypothetical protein ACH5RR_022063 [Cinchona calisaya]|uniref:Uncharacterized protein n=1 Tax=Cinchona calisaya TaxID=153742 RepID=A0ABD2Z6Q6_9GENT